MKSAETNHLPETCSVAFKEWAGVCSALGRGLQSIILRKGGIAEGPGGFTPEHPVFWLYPTRVHQEQQRLKVDGLGSPGRADADDSTVEVDTLAVVELIGRVDRREILPNLESLHVWTKETVEKKFSYRQPGLWVLGVRVLRRPEPFRLRAAPEYLGCKSWAPLGRALPTDGLVNVIDEGRSRAALTGLRAAIGLETLPA